ncbi:MAG: hydrophobe/amphiphile efflux-3 (HAE3) family transporter [Dehalococcoidia bacterium]|nr:hydrophobe/amphiphile efflux-3 (HAE3) family transporter [Dehalococcoidia bacterium]
MRRVWLPLTAVISRYHLPVVVAAVIATIILALGIPRIHFKTGQDTLLPANSKVYQDNLRYQNQFGGDPMLVLFEGDVLRLFEPSNLSKLEELEGSINADSRYFSVVSPLTVVQTGLEQMTLQQEIAVRQLAERQEEAAAQARNEAAAAGASLAEQEAAADAARAQVAQEFAAERGADAERFAQVGELSLENPRLVEFLLFDATGQVRPEMADIVPDREHGLMVIRLNGNMSIDEQAAAAGDLTELVRGYSFDGLHTLPSGPAILIKEINDSMRDNLVRMGALATALMVVVLLLVFRADWPLLSLPVVLIGCVWAFGLMGFLGLPLTMVTISGLPILIGLGVDFAIQFHSRFDEELRRTGSMRDALAASLPRIGTAVAVAVLAASAGFLVLHISRVPMIRDFGSMLAVGTIILFFAGLLFLHSVLFLRGRRASRSVTTASRRRGLQVENVVNTITANTVGRLLPVIAIGLFVVLLGLFLDQRIPLQTDPEKFIPQNSPVLKDLYYIRDTAGSTSELGILVEADDVLRPDVLSWMQEFQQEQMAQHPELQRANSLASVVSQAGNGRTPDRGDVEALLSVTPESVLKSLVSADHRQASIVFSVGDMSLNERRAIVREIEADTDLPPGVSITAGGLSVIGAETANALSQNRGLMTIAALGAITVGLLLVYRNPVKAVLPVLPIVLALGGSSVILYLLGIELNPLTSVSGPLIIAMGTEFTILLMSRYFEERENGHEPRPAMRIASLQIGRAIAASGLTVIGGFAALAFSNFPLLESFGKVTVLDMALCLMATLVVLPPLLVWLDEETRLVAVERVPAGRIDQRAG